MKDLGKVLAVTTFAVCFLAIFDPRFRKGCLSLLCEISGR
jgi:hypothetical protein